MHGCETGCSCCSTFHGERVHSASVALRTYSPEHFSKHLVDSWTPAHHLDTTWTPPGHHLDTTWTPPGHHLDITWTPPAHRTSPGHLLNTSWTPAHLHTWTPGHLVGIWWSPGHLVDTWWTHGGPLFDMTPGKKSPVVPLIVHCWHGVSLHAHRKDDNVATRQRLC